MSIDFLSDDPKERPLTYPGRIPHASGIVAPDGFRELLVQRGQEPAQWIAQGDDPARVEVVLSRYGCDARRADIPVLAVGSNASPGQMVRKFQRSGVTPVFIMARSEVSGIASGVSAHINKAGYIPAAPIIDEGTSSLFVLYLSEDQLYALDATEPNYARKLISKIECEVKLPNGVRLPEVFLYVSRHGYLVDEADNPYPLQDQRALILGLLSRSLELRGKCGDSPEEFVSNVRDLSVREAAYAILRSEGWVRPQPRLSNLAEA